eukprot:gene44-638_t
MTTEVKIDIEYWCLASDIKKAVPDAEVSGFVGRSRSFEVKLNGKEIFSKLSKGSFPNMDKIVEMVKNVSQGGQLEEVTEMEEASCVVL